MTTTTAFKKGEKRPNQGKRGPNKVTKELKQMILEALDNAGGVEYLERKANDPRTASAFLTLIGKVLPMQVANADGEEFKVERVVRFIKAEPAKNAE